MSTFLSCHKLSLASLITAIALLISVSASLAGTSVKIIQSSPLLTGPGPAYSISGAVSAEEQASVERCKGLWCEIKTPSATGWIDKAKISFGQHARVPLSGPHFDRKSGGPGTVCFYDSPGFSGQSICGSSGFVIRDLAKTGFDNRIQSITISGSVSAMVCRDFFFSSYCAHITADTQTLDRFLKRSISSIRVY